MFLFDCMRHSPPRYVVFALLLTVYSANALSIQNINAFFGDISDSGVIAQIRQNEATMLKLNATIPNTCMHDSLLLFLRQSFTKMRCSELPGTSLRSELISGLLLLELGNLGLPLYFDTAKTVLDKIERRFPGNNIVTWMHSLCYVRSGEITRGIRMFDSLYVSGFHDEDFLTDYASYVFHAIVPRKAAIQSVLIKSIMTTLPDTLGPSTREWSMERFDDKRKLPCFMYGATFEIQKPFHLVFQRKMLKNNKVFQLGSFPKAPVSNPAFEPFAKRTDIIRCRLFIDLNETGNSLVEYLSSRISGKYDSINVNAELKGQQGVSLRCYTLPRFLDDMGKYTAIALFDRPFLDIQKQRGPKFTAPEFKTIRYTLVLQSSADEQDISEEKFQSILCSFID